MPNYLFKGCVFCYVSIDTEDLKFIWKEHNECLCVTSDCCLAIGDDGYGCGLVTEGNEICKLGCVFCTWGLQKPDTCTKGASHCLCVKRAGAIPFDGEYVSEPICAICCCQLLPKLEFAAEAPGLSSMVR